MRPCMEIDRCGIRGRRLMGLHLWRVLLAGVFLSGVTARADLVASFTREGVTDSRMDLLPALCLQVGEPATPFLTPGAFQVVWKGKLVIPRRQRLIFSFEGKGTASLKIAGKEILTGTAELVGAVSDSTRLNPGEHDIELNYSSPPDGSATFRFFWEEPGFPRQSVPSSAFKGDANDATALGAMQRRGRFLFANHHCAKCHVPGGGLGSAPMPEISEIGPILFGIGDRASEEWLRRWIAEPHAIKPSTRMPALVDGSSAEGLQQASDLAAYLAGLRADATDQAPQPAAAHDAKQVQDGGVHFHELGCIACHQSPDKDAVDSTRVPLNQVASKYLPGALVAFLKKPDAYHPFTGMPDFKLSDAEAASIAAYLSQASAGRQTGHPQDFPPGDAVRGGQVAESLQCGVCHPGMPMSLPKLPASLETIFKKDWATSGCVAPAERRGKAPRLNLDDPDRAALVAFAKAGSGSLSRDTSAEFVRRQVEALRCTACHAMEGREPLLSGLHAESQALVAHLPKINERLDQTRPSLTFTGEMLYTTAIESMIAGSAEPRPRPWLGMRMPSFRSYAAPLAKGFSKLHGLNPNGPVVVNTDPVLVETGKNLVGAGGFGCNTCHGIGDVKPTAAFEVEGVNFKLVPARIREEYFHRWMDNPSSVTPGTKMPRYSEGRKSQRIDVLEGDAKKQYDAIWQYLHAQ